MTLLIKKSTDTGAVQVTELNEIWKPIPGFPDYEVSDHGRVRSFKRGSVRILKASPVSKLNKYPAVNLSAGGRVTYFKVHQLVMLAFVGPCPDGLEVCHGDDNPLNNRLDNLRYDTHTANMMDCVTSGKMGLFSPDQVLDMRQRYLSGLSREALAQEYGCSTPSIHRLLVGRSYAYVDGSTKEVFIAKRKRARSIREEYAQGNVSYSQLSQKYELTPSQISLIVTGKRSPEAGGPIKGIDY